MLDKLASDPDIDTPIPGLIIEYRRLTKLVNTYLVALKDAINPDTGRIHASFNQTVAATGRLSSSDPNLQNIPIRTEVGREIRRAFVAPEGRVLISADYSQIELRLLAHLSQDPALIAAFHAGADIHRAVAAQVHGVTADDVTREQRDGAEDGQLRDHLRRHAVRARAAGSACPTPRPPRSSTGTRPASPASRRSLKNASPRPRDSAMSRRCSVAADPSPDITSNNPSRRALAERMAINSVVQGSAADLIKLAMIDLHRRIKVSPPSPSGEGGPRSGSGEGSSAPSPPGGGRGEGGPTRSDRVRGSSDLSGVLMLLQIHDELVFEADESTADAARAVVVERMEQAMTLDVPLVVDSAISTNWFEGK